MVDCNCCWHYLGKLKMSFRIRDLETILFAGLISCVLPLAQAQNTSGGDHIIYSSPQGKAASSAPVPMTQAPQAQEPESPPSSPMSVDIFADPAQQQMFPVIPPAQLQNNAQNQDDITDPMGVRKELSVPTAAEMMKVPTPEQMFGLPDRNPLDATIKPSDLTTGDTNDLSLEKTDEPVWANVWSGKTGDVNSNGTERASGFFGGFFDNATRNEDGFGNHDWGSTETSFGAPQTTGEPQASGEQGASWVAGLGAGTPSVSVGQAQNNFSSPNDASSGGFGSQSPFLPPQARRFDSTKALPQLPALPAVPGRKDVDAGPQTAPSWVPKPPPWTQSQTPFGTAVQLNPQH